MREMFAVLDRELACGLSRRRGFTLADAFLLPLIHYMRLMPESGEMMEASPHYPAGSIASPHGECKGDRAAADARPRLSRAGGA